MKSFLENIDDKILTWNKEDDYDNDDSSSDSSLDSSLDNDGGGDDGNENDIEIDMDENDSLVAVGEVGAAAQGNHQLRDNNNNNNNNNNNDDDRQDLVEFGDINEQQRERDQDRERDPNAPEELLAQQIVRGDNQDNDNAEGNIPQRPRTRVTVARVVENLSNHPRNQQLVSRIARSEQHPLVRADIDWELLKAQLRSYPASEVGDHAGGVLLQGILRMDPPLDVVKETLDVFPRSCIDMDSFFTACQYSTTSATSTLSSLNIEQAQHEQSVVQLIMRHTMDARHKEGIQWGMLAFLGDARITTKHAKLLLQSIPGAVTDPSHGIFGVSPLDRMLSGAFIHGNGTEWVEKVKLALLTAEFGSVDECPPAAKFFPFHALIRRLTSPDFMGVQFGAFTFIRTLMACMRSGKCRMHKRDDQGRLPIHVALEEECITHLGTAGERKLIKFFLQVHPESVSIGNKHGNKPLRLAVKNGWPVYDLILDTMSQQASESSRDSEGNLPIHIALGGMYHASFGIAGAREIVRYILKISPTSAHVPDSKGTLPLQLALQYGWPCHDILISAAPQALETRQIQTGFYPFQIAACSLWTIKQNDDESSHKDVVSLRALSVLYELIREGPLLTHGLASSSSPDGASDAGQKNTNDKPLGGSKKRKLETSQSPLPKKTPLE